MNLTPEQLWVRHVDLMADGNPRLVLQLDLPRVEVDRWRNAVKGVLNSHPNLVSWDHEAYAASPALSTAEVVRSISAFRSLPTVDLAARVSSLRQPTRGGAPISAFVHTAGDRTMSSLFLSIDHVLCDGMGIVNLGKHLLRAVLYGQCCDGDPPAVGSTSSAVRAKNTAYWMDQLHDEPLGMISRRATPSWRGALRQATITWTPTDIEWTGILDAARAARCTTFCWLTSALVRVATHMTGQDDMVCHVNVANRRSKAELGFIGQLAVTVPLRVRDLGHLSPCDAARGTARLFAGALRYARFDPLALHECRVVEAARRGSVIRPYMSATTTPPAHVAPACGDPEISYTQASGAQLCLAWTQGQGGRSDSGCLQLVVSERLWPMSGVGDLCQMFVALASMTVEQPHARPPAGFAAPFPEPRTSDSCVVASSDVHALCSSLGMGGPISIQQRRGSTAALFTVDRAMTDGELTERMRDAYAIATLVQDQWELSMLPHKWVAMRGISPTVFQRAELEDLVPTALDRMELRELRRVERVAGAHLDVRRPFLVGGGQLRDAPRVAKALVSPSGQTLTYRDLVSPTPVAALVAHRIRAARGRIW